ncbi:MAG: hypothetical protein AAFW70_28410 [Cyanobacteria bacterium J06635_10]
MKINIKPICPINYKCPAVKYCPNFSTCYDLSHAWEIPLERRKDGLYVKRIAGRCDKYGNQPYLDYHEEEIKQRIMQCWNNAGYVASIPLAIPPSALLLRNVF